MTNIVSNLVALIIIYIITRLFLRNKFNNNKIIFISCIIFIIYYLSTHKKYTEYFALYDTSVKSVGSIIKTSGNIIDDAGNIINASGQIIAKAGSIIDNRGQIIDTTDANIDKAGNIIDSSGNILAYAGEIMSRHIKQPNVTSNNDINHNLKQLNNKSVNSTNNKITVMNDNALKLNDQLYKMLEIMDKNKQDEIKHISNNFTNELNELKRELRNTNKLYSTVTGDWKENY
jgi:hypothetical protein